MNAEVNISLTYQQVLDLVKQLPLEQKILLTKDLEKDAINTKLSLLLQTFQTNELSEDLINKEVEAVRLELYEQSKKQ